MQYNGLPLTRHQALALQEPLSASNFSVLWAQVGPGKPAFFKVKMPFHLICQPQEVKQSIPSAKILIRRADSLWNRKTYYCISTLSSCSDLMLKSKALRSATHKHLNIRGSGDLLQQVLPSPLPPAHASGPATQIKARTLHRDMNDTDEHKTLTSVYTSREFWFS